MTTVIDVGCARYGGDYSIERLLDFYNPSWLYGFDPAWTPEMFHPPHDLRAWVHVANVAAWTHDGEVRFMLDGLNGQVGDAEHWPFVPCVDLARFIDKELPDGPVILKLDAEGSEYDLLEHLIETKVDLRLERVLVEWHQASHAGLAKRKDKIEKALTCPVEEWAW